MTTIEPLRNAVRRRTGKAFGSRIARLILASNLAGLAILIIGAMVLNEMRAGLVVTRKQSLEIEAQVIAGLLADEATIGEPAPGLDEDAARATLRKLDLPTTVRARVLGVRGKTIGDSFFVSERVDISSLPPLRAPRFTERVSQNLSAWSIDVFGGLLPRETNSAVKTQSYDEEFRTALAGNLIASQRFSDRGQRIISVSIPIQRVSAVVGVLTLEASDVDEIVRAERAALIPFIGVAVLVALITSVLLTLGIARPLRRLSFAADKVRTGSAQALDLPRVTGRKDEIGDLAQSIQAMTTALFDRLSANAQFAADVAHELKNPLTSIRSAVETADLVDDDPDARARLRQVIAKDVQRLDRLITDISNASRLEADVSRMPESRIDICQLLMDIVQTYEATRKDKTPGVVFRDETMGAGLLVKGRAGPLGQVFRNLIDNARSFAPVDRDVRVTLSQGANGIRTLAMIRVEDDGPGIPEDKLTKIFDRFYTDRPAGAAFGNNSGLGLSIVKQIIESHQGSVMASNRREGGARFTVSLPAR